eukprot:1290915-Prorocentrum_lima.AAC.1
MTSSLVGSEMCIRDSKNAVPCRGGSTSDAVRHSSHTPHASGGPPSGTVSYTHLTLPTICSV